MRPLTRRMLTLAYSNVRELITARSGGVKKRSAAACRAGCTPGASGQIELTMNPRPEVLRMIVYPVSAEKADASGCRPRVRQAGAPASLGDHRRGAGEGAGSPGAGGDGRVAHGPGRPSDGPSAAGRGGRDPLLVRDGVEGRALPAEFPPWQAGYASSSGGVPGCRSGWSIGCGGSGGRAPGAPSCRRGGDRLSVGQGRGHGRGRDELESNAVRRSSAESGTSRGSSNERPLGSCWSSRPACRSVIAADARRRCWVYGSTTRI